MEKKDLFELFELIFEVSAKIVTIDSTPQHFGIDVPLTRTEIHMISAIAGLGSPSVTELAKEKGVTKGAVSQILRKLEKKGLIDKQVDPHNSSRLAIRLNEKGRLADENHNRVHEAVYHAFIQDFGDLDEEAFNYLKSFWLTARQFLDRWESVRM